MQALLVLLPLGLLLLAAAGSSASSSPAPRPAPAAPERLPVTNVSDTDKPQRRGKAPPSREPDPKPKPRRARDQTLENVAVAVTETVLRKVEQDKERRRRRQAKPKPSEKPQPQPKPSEKPQSRDEKPPLVGPDAIAPHPTGTPLEQRIAAGGYLARMAKGRLKPGALVRFYQRLLGVINTGVPDQRTHNAAMVQMAKVPRAPSAPPELARKAAQRLLAQQRSASPNARVMIDQLAIGLPPEEWDGILGKRTHEAARLLTRAARPAADKPAKVSQPASAAPAPAPAPAVTPAPGTVNVPVAAAKELFVLLDRKQVRADQKSPQVASIQKLMGMTPQQQDGLAGPVTQWRALHLLDYPKDATRSQIEAANSFAGKLRKKEIGPKNKSDIVRDLQRRMGMAATAQDGYAGPQTQAWALRVLELGAR